MLFKSDRMTSASGSIGGTTFSHNRFGLYTRARRVPVNPNSSFQQDARSAFSTQAAAWRALTALERAGWDAYAASSPTTGSLGDTIHLSGFQWFVATNSLNDRLAASVITTAPLTPGRIALGTPTVVIDASAGTVAVSGGDGAADGGNVGVFLGDAQSAGVTFFNGPYQLRAVGSPSGGAFTTAAITGRNGVAFVTGARIPYRLAGTDANSQLTTVASGIATVVA